LVGRDQGQSRCHLRRRDECPNHVGYRASIRLLAADRPRAMAPLRTQLQRRRESVFETKAISRNPGCVGEARDALERLLLIRDAGRAHLWPGGWAGYGAGLGAARRGGGWSSRTLVGGSVCGTSTETTGGPESAGRLRVMSSRAADPGHQRTTHERWSKAITHTEWRHEQCGRCSWYVPLAGSWGYDWGACSNAASPNDRHAVFEHDGCPAFDDAGDWASVTI
jgi:hypothetical protein